MKKILILIIFAVLLITPAYAEDWVELSSGMYMLRDEITYNYKYKFATFWVKTIATAPYTKINHNEIRETQIFITLDCKTSSFYASGAIFIDADGKVIGGLPTINPNLFREKIDASLGSIGYYLCKEVNSKQEE